MPFGAARSMTSGSTNGTRGFPYGTARKRTGCSNAPERSRIPRGFPRRRRRPSCAGCCWPAVARPNPLSAGAGRSGETEETGGHRHAGSLCPGGTGPDRWKVHTQPGRPMVVRDAGSGGSHPQVPWEPAHEGRGALVGVTLSVPPVPHWLRSLSERPGLSSRLLACQPLPPSGTRSVHLLELAGPENELRVAVSSVARSSSRTVALSPGARGRVLLRVIARTGGSCRAVFRSGGICRTCRFRTPRRQDGRVGWEILTTHPPSALPEMEPLSWRRGRDRTLRSLGNPHPYASLTGRQEEALRCADRLGYFSVPRRAGLGAVAGALGIGRSAAAELLRRGVSVLIQALDGPGLSGSPASRRTGK